MKKAAVNYKSLYEQSLKRISEKEKQIAEERELLKESKKILVTERSILAKTKEALIEKDQKIIQLSFELDKFRKYLFGKKSEKLTPFKADASQISLFELGTSLQQQEELSKQAIELAEKKTPKKRAKGKGRMALPEDLRREVIIIEPTEDVSDCVCIQKRLPKYWS